MSMLHNSTYGGRRITLGSGHIVAYSKPCSGCKLGETVVQCRANGGQWGAYVILEHLRKSSSKYRCLLQNHRYCGHSGSGSLVARDVFQRQTEGNPERRYGSEETVFHEAT